MADLAIIRRAKDHELRVFFSQDEFKLLFDGRTPDEEPVVQFGGNARSGLVLHPVPNATSAKFSQNQRRVKPIDRRFSSDQTLAAQIFIPTKKFGFVEEYRATTRVKSTPDGTHRLVLSNIPQAWHGPNIGDFKPQEVLPAAPAEPIPVSARPPQPEPGMVWDPTTSGWARPEASRDAPIKPTPPAKPEPPRVTRDSQEDVETTEAAARGVYLQPMAEKSSLPAMGADKEMQTAALRRLLALAADVNAEMRRLKSIVRLEVDPDTQMLNLLRIYRPGQARLRMD